MAEKIMEIIKDGKHLRRYKFYHRGALQGWTITDSPEKLCQLYGWDMVDCQFEQEAFSMWDYMNTGATPVKEENKEVK